MIEKGIIAKDLALMNFPEYIEFELKCKGGIVSLDKNMDVIIPYDEESLWSDFVVNIMCGKKNIGHILGRLIYPQECSEYFELFDSISGETLDLYNDLADLSEKIYNSEKACEGEEYEMILNVFNEPICLISSIEIDKKYRGHNFSHYVIMWLYKVINGTFFLEPGIFSDEYADLSKQEILTGTKKLRKHWEKIGFKRMSKKSKFWFLRKCFNE